MLLIGAQELMVTEHCMLMSQGPCDENCAECPRRKSPHVLKDRKGYEFPVVTDAMGRSHLYNAVELDIASSMPELLAAGISSYMVDATLMNAEETAHAVGRAIRARTWPKTTATPSRRCPTPPPATSTAASRSGCARISSTCIKVSRY